MEDDDERHQALPPDPPRPGSSAITPPTSSYTSATPSWLAPVPAPVVPGFQFAKAPLASGPSKGTKGISFAGKAGSVSAAGERGRGFGGGEGGLAESGGRGTSSDTLTTSSSAERDSRSDVSGDRTQGEEEEDTEMENGLETQKQRVPLPLKQQPGPGADAPRPTLANYRLPPPGAGIAGGRPGLFPPQNGMGTLGGHLSNGQRGVASPVNRTSTNTFSSPAFPSTQARPLPTSHSSVQSFGLPHITPTPSLAHGNLSRPPSTKATVATSFRPGSSSATTQQLLAESNNSKKRPHPTSSSAAPERVCSSLVGRPAAKGSGGTLAGSRTSSGGTNAGSRTSSKTQGDSPPRQKRHKGPLGDVWGRLSDIQSELESKDNEIAKLRAQLDSKSAEASTAIEEKDRIKREFSGKVHAALKTAEKTQKELSSSAVSMRSAFQDIGEQLGGVVEAQEIKEDLDTIRASISNLRTPNGEYSVEKLEGTKVGLLKTLENQVEKCQGVIDLLRIELDSKIGENVEARDRVSQLEAQVSANAVAHGAIVSQVEQITQQALNAGTLSTKLQDERDRYALLQAQMEEERARCAKSEKELEEVKSTVGKLEKNNDNLLATKTELEDKAKLLQLQNNDIEPLRSQLASAKADVEDAKRRLADSVAISKAEDERARQKLADAASEATSAAKEHQIVVNNLKEFSEQLKSQSSSKDQVIKDGEQRLAQSLAREKEQVTIQADLRVKLQDALAALADSCKEKQASDLRALNAEKLVHDKKHLDQSSLASLQEANDALAIKNDALDSKNTDILISNAALSARIAALNSDKEHAVSEAQLEQSQLTSMRAELATAQAEIASMRSELAATAEQAAGYRNENAGLAASEQSIKARTEQILASHASEMQERVLQAVKTCDERHKREDAPKSNELKRLNNKLEDATKKLQKALTELAKAKNRPLIDPHIASSSPVELESDQPRPGPSTNRQQVVAAAQENAATDQPPIIARTTLSAIDAASSESDDIIDCTLPAPKGRGKDKAVEKTSANAGKTGRGGRRSRSTTEAIKEKQLVDEEIEDDDVVLAPVQKARPATKTTYSKKKK